MYTEHQYTFLEYGVKAWVKSRNGASRILQVTPGDTSDHPRSYLLSVAYEKDSDGLGRILFDEQGYWIYDGDDLTVDEQEQVVKVIARLKEGRNLWNS